MSPKKALLILLILAAIIALAISALYFKNRLNQTELKQGAGAINNFKNPGQAAQEKEQKIKQQEELVNKKIQEKNAQINAKPKEVIQKQGYTQAELDFIANPKATVEEELGIKPVQPKPAAKPYTQSQLDAIANPKK